MPDKDDRPLRKLKADEIEELFTKSDKNQSLSQKIVKELSQRKTMRARSLLDFVKKAVGLGRVKSSECSEKESSSQSSESDVARGAADDAARLDAKMSGSHPNSSGDIRNEAVSEIHTGLSLDEPTNAEGALVQPQPLPTVDLTPPAGGEGTELLSTVLQTDEIAATVISPGMETEGLSIEPESPTIEILIKENAVSARLINCAEDDFFRSTTLEWALANPQEFEKACFNVPKIGRTSFAELKRIIEYKSKKISDNPEFNFFYEAKNEKIKNLSKDGITVHELIESSNASVRLKNCISKSSLGNWKAVDAFSDLAAVDAECRLISGMGRKSIRELQEILEAFSKIGERQSERGNARGVPVSNLSELLLQALARLFGEITLEQACGYGGASVRLRNGVRRSSFKNVGLGELFLDWEKVCKEIQRLPNLGRSSLGELADICATLIRRSLENAYIDDTAAKHAADFILHRVPVPEEVSADLIGTLQGISNFGISDLSVSEVLPLAEITEILLSGLSERAREIIERRFGIGREQAETLEQIGADHNVTRERIRQVEKKALEALASSAQYMPIMDCLIAYGEEAWRSLGGAKGYLTQGDIKNVRNLPADFTLLAEVGGLSITDWLNAFAVRWEAGWCEKSFDFKSLDETARAISSELMDKPLPRPCPQWAEESGPRLAPIVVELMLGKKLYGGYVFDANRGTRLVKRVIELHSMFGSEGRPNDAAELVQRLSVILSSPTISIRYIAMIMSRYPHLFLEGDDGEWFGIGVKDILRDAVEFEFAPLSLIEGNEADDAFTMAGFLKGIIERTGPMKFTDIVAEAQKTLPSDRSISSVGPTMLMHREVFVRALPGVYGLHQAMPGEDELMLRPPTYLINEEQCRLFALGRRAGEPWGAFRLWTPAAEYALCSWAKKYAHSALFESLLTVASVEEWPVNDQDKAEWRQLVHARGGKFHLHFEPRSEVGYALPKLDRLLAACLEARAFGKFNWIVGNRILNRQADAHSSAGLIALMNALGALQFEPTSNWQMPQIRGPLLNEILGQLEDELHNFGELNWQSPLGRQLMQKARERGATMGGWMNERLLLSMVDGGEATKPAFGIEEDLSDLEKLLLEFGQANEAKMFDKMLDDLASSDDLSEAIS